MPATSLLTWTWSRILTLSRGATTVFDTAAEMPPATKSRAKSLLFIPPPPIFRDVTRHNHVVQSHLGEGFQTNVIPQYFILGALYPSMSGLMNKHIVKHIVPSSLGAYTRLSPE